MRRNEETKARYEEFCDKRVNMLTSLMNKESMKKRKYNDSDDQGKENILVQLKDKEDRIESLEHTNERLNEVIEKLKTSLKVLAVLHSHFELNLSYKYAVSTHNRIFHLWICNLYSSRFSFHA